MNDPQREDDGPETQNWACGPLGWWPVPGFPPVGVTWSYFPEREVQHA